MRVIRSHVDDSNIETLVETGRGDAARLDPRNWCVGIAVDTDRGKIRTVATRPVARPSTTRPWTRLPRWNREIAGTNRPWSAACTELSELPWTSREAGCSSPTW